MIGPQIVLEYFFQLIQHVINFQAAATSSVQMAPAAAHAQAPATHNLLFGQDYAANLNSVLGGAGTANAYRQQ